MKAAVYRRYGPPDLVQIAEVPGPDLAPKDVLVKVRATTVTYPFARIVDAHAYVDTGRKKGNVVITLD